MKTKPFVISMLVILALCVAAISCNKDVPSTPTDSDNTDNPNNTEISDSLTDCIDPEDAITVNLRNDGGSVTILNHALGINTANNFICDPAYITLACVGELSGLGCVSSIPQSGWSNQVAVIPGNGYVLKFEIYNGAVDSYIVKYARLYVVRYLLNTTNEGILGAEIKYQENWLEPSVVSTGSVTEITQTTAVCGGNLISDGGVIDTERGICWSTTEEPTINDNHAISGTGIGEYYIQITNLTPNTRYYVRAYAQNSIGISYGEQSTFKTHSQIGNDYSALYLNELNGNDKFIEIYNAGVEAVNLEGVYIEKDGIQNWIGDNTVVIEVGDYLVLYSEDVAIDHPEVPETMVFHSGLSAKKNIRIQLFTPTGVSIDDFNLVDIYQNAPEYIPYYGSYSRNANNIWYYASATPGTRNVDGTVLVLGLEGGAKESKLK